MDIKCSMCRSTWLIEFKDEVFHPNKKTCKDCSRRAGTIRLNKQMKKIEDILEEIRTNEPTIGGLYELKQFRKYLIYYDTH